MSLERFWPASFEKMSTITTRQQDKSRTERQQQEEATSEANASEDMDSLDPATAKAFQAMTEHITKAIDNKLSPLLQSIEALVSGIQKAEKRLDEVEERVEAVETTTVSNESRVEQLEKQLQDTMDRLDSMEDRNRRDNVRIYGIAEGVEGGDPVKFFESWIPQILKLNTKAGSIKLDRCHRLGPKNNPNPRRGGRPGGAAAPPRGVILKVHHSRDKKRVMDAARQAMESGGQLKFQGADISFYNDFSQGTIKKRKSFDDVRKQLRAKNVEYSTLFNGVLRIKHNGKVMLCDTPEKAADFLHSLSPG